MPRSAARRAATASISGVGSIPSTRATCGASASAACPAPAPRSMARSFRRGAAASTIQPRSGPVGVRPARAVVLGHRGPLGRRRVVASRAGSPGTAADRPGPGRGRPHAAWRPGGPELRRRGRAGHDRRAQGGEEPLRRRGDLVDAASNAAASRTAGARTAAILRDVLAGGVVDVARGGGGRGATAQGANASAHARSVARPALQWSCSSPRAVRHSPPNPVLAHDPRLEVSSHACSIRDLRLRRRRRGRRCSRICVQGPTLVSDVGRRPGGRRPGPRRRRPRPRRDGGRDARRGRRGAPRRRLAVAGPDGLQPRRLVQLRRRRHEGHQRGPDRARAPGARRRRPRPELARHGVRGPRPRPGARARALRRREARRGAGGGRAGAQGRRRRASRRPPPTSGPPAG